MKGLPGEDREGIAKDDKDHVFKIYNSNNDGHIGFLIQYFLINIATVALMPCSPCPSLG